MLVQPLAQLLVAHGRHAIDVHREVLVFAAIECWHYRE